MSGFYLNTKEYKDYRFGPLLGYEGRNFLKPGRGAFDDGRLGEL